VSGINEEKRNFTSLNAVTLDEKNKDKKTLDT
jgi:hypothetical protein